jgi:hypothetical protein
MNQPWTTILFRLYWHFVWKGLNFHLDSIRIHRFSSWKIYLKTQKFSNTQNHNMNFF